MKKIILGICENTLKREELSGMTNQMDVVKLMIIDPTVENDDLQAPIISLKPNKYNRLSWQILCDLLSPDNQKYLLVIGEEDKPAEIEKIQNNSFFGIDSLAPSKFSLTRQQRVIMDLAVEGLLTKQIAERLCRSYHTIKHHLSKIYKKMGVNCMPKAIDIYIDYRKRMN
jgi:ATP/maltotriose-dependent transcriptional regulator MalT